MSTAIQQSSENTVPAELQRLYNARIEAHLQGYQAAQNMEAALPFMEPFHYQGFADGASRDVAQWTCAGMTALFDEVVPRLHRGDQQVAAFAVTPAVAASMQSRFRQSFVAFEQALGQFGALLNGFRQQMQSAGERVDGRAEGAGMLGGLVGGFLLGPLGALAGGAAAGFFAGKSIDDELQAAAASLQESFVAMLGTWDVATEQLAMASLSEIATYRESLLAAVEAAKREEENRRLLAAAARPLLPGEVAGATQPSTRWALVSIVVSLVLVVIIVAGAAYLFVSRVPSPPVGATTPAPAQAATPSPNPPSAEKLAVLKKGASVFEGPARTFKLVRRTKVLAPVRLSDESVPGWFRVELNDKSKGWVERRFVDVEAE